MRAKEVLSTLQISRSTLRRYRLNGYLKSTKLPSGQYEFDDESVYALRNQKQPRLTVLYGRVSTYKQKNDLSNQMASLEKFANKRGFSIDREFQDIASGISFKNRKQFFELLDLILDYKVERVIITHKDRLSRVGFDLFSHLFSKFGTKVIVMSEYLDPKTDEQEIFSEIIALLHCFAMKQYSSRRKLKAKLDD